MSNEGFDFYVALQRALDAVDVGPHCSCAEITAEILRAAIPVQWPGLRCAAAGFGGGVGGSGSTCGAFAAGLVALGTLIAERYEPRGCVSDLILPEVQAYHDEWMERYGSVCCADLTGHPALREDRIREAFFANGGPQKCTDNYIRFAVERTLQSAKALEASTTCSG